MKKRGLSQERLKLIACVTMLLDHIGATIVLSMYYANPTGTLLSLYKTLRIIGRLSFPIYCFLLAEGSFHTRNPKRYALRLALSALLSEIPYDLAFYDGITWQHQNVMVTLFLGFLALETMKKYPQLFQKVLAAIPFALLADIVKCDYRWEGVMLIVLFGLTRDLPHKGILQFLGIWFLFSPGHIMAFNWLDGFSLVTQEWAVLALIPLYLYSGKKQSGNKWVQWAFYLFYPLHLLTLYVLGGL